MERESVISLRTILKTAVQKETGERIIGAEIDRPKSSFSASRTANGDSAFKGLIRQAYYQQGGSLGGINATAPQFYSPFTTPSSFQIPNNRKEVYLWAQFWYDNEPKVAAGIDFYRDFPVADWELECSNSYVKDYFDKLVKKLELNKWIPLISHERHLRGDAFAIASIDCETCHGSSEWRDSNGDICEHEGATWNSLDILDPNMVDVLPGIMGREATYSFIPTDDMKKIVATREPKHIYDSMPEELRMACMSQTPIKINPICIYHFKHGASAFSPFGTSLIRRLFPTLTYRDKLRQAQWIIAERLIVPIKVVKIGSQERPASEDDLESMEEQISTVSNDPLLTLVTHHDFSMDYVGASGKILQLTPEFEIINQDIIDGLMLNKAIINGEGPTAAGANVGLLSMQQRLEGFRKLVAYWLEERIFRPVSVWNGFTSPGERGQEELIYPTIKWNDLELRDNTGKIQTMAAMQQNGSLSLQTLWDELDIDHDQEVERLRFENASNTIDSPSLASANNGMLGGGFTGSFSPPPGGSPGGMPDLNAGGLPPAGGGGSPMGALPVAASVDNPDEAYRLAVSISNSAYRNVIAGYSQNVAARYASRRFKSAAHQGFIESQMPPTGRGALGAIPVEMEVFPIKPGPEFGGINALPQNQMAWEEWMSVYANRIVNTSSQRFASSDNNRFAKKDPRKPNLFTEPERQLYNIVLSCNIPYAFYAQYQAGPSLNYQLDGAFPAVKLGVEADHKTYHSSPEAVAKDRRRDQELATQGWVILRFTDEELKGQQDAVQQAIIVMLRRMVSGSSQIEEKDTL